MPLNINVLDSSTLIGVLNSMATPLKELIEKENGAIIRSLISFVRSNSITHGNTEYITIEGLIGFLLRLIPGFPQPGFPFTHGSTGNIAIGDLMRYLESQFPGNPQTPMHWIFRYISQHMIQIDLSLKLLQPFLGNFGVSQRFNVNQQDYPGTGGHGGIDYGTPVGTPILAAYQGEVSVVGPRMLNDPYGRHLRIQRQAYDRWDESRLFTMIYGHLSQVDVVVNQYVNTGDQIGLSGGDPSDPLAGKSDGPHLHFGIISLDSQKRGETFLNYDYINPGLYFEPNLSINVIEKRIVNTAWLNIRSRPDLGSTVRYQIANGTVIDIYEIQNDPFGNPWGALDSSRTGWVNLNYTVVTIG